MKQILVLFAFFAVCALGAAPGAGTAGYDITPLMTSLDGGGIQLWGGKHVPLNTMLQPGFRVLFEDLFPGANWGHPALIKVLNKEGAVVEQTRTTRPPEGIEEAPQIWGPDTNSTNVITFKLNDFKGKYKIKNPDKFYAVLINGHANRRHWNDFSFFYRVLTTVYGYKKENIFIADGAFRSRSPDLDGSGKPVIQYGSDIKDIRKLMSDLATKLKADDHLVLAVNDHGGSTRGESTIILHDGEMSVTEFKQLMASLKPQKVLTLYEQCFSGGFVRPSVSGYEKVSMSAAKNSEYSWASMDLNFDAWIYHAIAAFAHQTYKGEPIHVETTRDGHVTAQQAFAYAVAQDRRPESPLLESYNNSGGATRIGVDF